MNHNPGGTMTTATNWIVWALLSAVFAALTAIFAKIGIKGVDSDLATLVRTGVIIVVLSAFVWLTGRWSNPFAWSSRTCAASSWSRAECWCWRSSDNETT